MGGDAEGDLLVGDGEAGSRIVMEQEQIQSQLHLLHPLRCLAELDGEIVQKVVDQDIVDIVASDPFENFLNSDCLEEDNFPVEPSLPSPVETVEEDNFLASADGLGIPASEADYFENFLASVPFEGFESSFASAPFEGLESSLASAAFEGLESSLASDSFEDFESSPAFEPFGDFENFPASVPFEDFESSPAFEPFEDFENSLASVPFEDFESSPASEELLVTEEDCDLAVAGRVGEDVGQPRGQPYQEPQ